MSLPCCLPLIPPNCLDQRPFFCRFCIPSRRRHSVHLPHWLYYWGTPVHTNSTRNGYIKAFVRACVLSLFSCVRLFETPWTVAHQASLSMGFPRQEYLRGLPCPPPRDLPNPEIESESLMFPALAGEFFITSATWEAPYLLHYFPFL